MRQYLNNNKGNKMKNTFKTKAERVVKISKNLEKRFLDNKIKNHNLVLFQNQRLLRILTKI